MKWKKIPSSMMVAVHRCKTQFSMSRVGVDRIEVHANVPKESPIRSDWDKKVLEITMSCGCKRWFGVADAIINSRLDMTILPSNNKNELINSWEDANDE